MGRLVLWVLFPVLVLTATVGACVQPPTYSNSVEPLGVGHKVSPYQDIRLGVIKSQNFGESIAFLHRWEEKASQGFFYPGPTASGFTNAITAALSSRFKSVVDLPSPAEARSKGVDMIMTLDTKVTLGSISFETTSISIDGIFTDRSGTPIDSVGGTGKATVSWPNTGPKYDAALAQAIGGFTNGLDGSQKLIAAAGPISERAKLAQAAARPTGPEPAAAPQFPTAPVAVAFRAVRPRPDDVAVIIGNADYAKLAKDIPNVKPAYADADSAKLYAVEALGVRPGNIIFLKDATDAQMIRVFGSASDPHGQLADWVKPGISRVFVYYAGHGAPAVKGGSPYLVPTDADAERIALNGYPLAQLYANLAKLPAKHVTVVLEACFSGMSQAGSVLAKASPVYIKVKAVTPPSNLTVIAAGAADQVASWEENGNHGLFTEYFLKGEAGAADKTPYGNGDGHVSLSELSGYLKGTMTYYARRYYGRDQVAQINTGGMR